ncbi:MAG: DUF7033 domain-containing protein [Saprospiraceae bacterium]
MPQTIAFFIEPNLEKSRPRIRYILDFLERHPLAPCDGIRFVLESTTPVGTAFITYGSASFEHPAGKHIPLERTLLTLQPPLRVPVYAHPYRNGERVLFAVSSTEKQQKTAFFNQNTGEFGFDWIATLFFYLSRIEEYDPLLQDLDAIGNMRSDAQFLPKNGLHAIPVVDQLVVAIYQALGFTAQSLPTRASLSHDLDSLQLFSDPLRLLRYLGGVGQRNHSIRAWPQIVYDYWKSNIHRQKDPADTFDWLLDLWLSGERTLYFGVMNRSTYDHFPDLQLPRMLQIRDLARAKGYRLGLHPSFNTWDQPTQWGEEMQLAAAWLDQPIRHTRQHYLHFKFPETADILENAGIESDGTLGYRDKIGFRAGTGFPFVLYCFAAERAYRWVAHPLVIMDVAWQREAKSKGMGMFECWEQFWADNAWNTFISLNIHNTYFYEPQLHGLPLRKMLAACAPK